MNDKVPTEQELGATDEVLDLSNEVFDYVMNELEGGTWRERFESFSPAEKIMLWICISDAFNDTTED